MVYLIRGINFLARVSIEGFTMAKQNDEKKVGLKLTVYLLVIGTVLVAFPGFVMLVKGVTFYELFHFSIGVVSLIIGGRQLYIEMH
jgi:hypothetical protein